MKIIDNLNEFIEKVDNMKKVNPLDLSSDQDLSIAIMNLISIEEHLMFSGAKTQDTSFYDLIEPIREDRKEFLGMIIKSYKGEVWCISKHLLATCMRLMEVGTKALSAGKKDEAYNFFDKELVIKKGEVIGQVIFQKYLTVDDDHAEGKRVGGFGSTSK